MPPIQFFKSSPRLRPPRAAAIFFLGFALAAGRSPAADADSPPSPSQEFRGAWIATVHNIDWPSRPDLPVSAQKRELLSLLDHAQRIRLNAVILQVRPACDALYRSEIEPWSPFLTGKMGRAPDPDDAGYDPLEFAVNAAHNRGLELHAWFNPFRALATKIYPASESHITRTNPELVRTYGNYLWLDPGEPLVRHRALAVVQDVVRRYDIDGVHIDDYFYPYPIKIDGTNIPFPDEKTYARYRDGGGERDLPSWRRENVNEFVRGLYEMVKSEKPAVKFGISPFGIWRPGVPESIVAQLDAYDQLFADSKHWLGEGWCDYFTPQLYWQIDPPDQSFPVLLKWWHRQNTSGKHLWPGIATDRVGGADGRNAYEMLRQVGKTRELADASSRLAGHVHWNMKALKTDRGGVASLLRKEAYGEIALVPACPWLEPKNDPASVAEPGDSPTSPPKNDTGAGSKFSPLPSASPPKLTVIPVNNSKAEKVLEVRWEQAGAGWGPPPPRWWVIQLRQKNPPVKSTSPWLTARVIPAAAGGHFQLPADGTYDRVAVRPVTPAGTIGPFATAELPSGE